jgi:hypothetical protein
MAHNQPGRGVLCTQRNKIEPDGPEPPAADTPLYEHHPHPAPLPSTAYAFDVVHISFNTARLGACLHYAYAPSKHAHPIVSQTREVLHALK